MFAVERNVLAIPTPGSKIENVTVLLGDAASAAVPIPNFRFDPSRPSWKVRAASDINGLVRAFDNERSINIVVLDPTQISPSPGRKEQGQIGLFTILNAIRFEAHFKGPVIVCSPYGAEHYSIRDERVTYLMKPSSVEEVGRAIEAALSR